MKIVKFIVVTLIQLIIGFFAVNLFFILAMIKSCILRFPEYAKVDVKITLEK